MSVWDFFPAFFFVATDIEKIMIRICCVVQYVHTEHILVSQIILMMGYKYFFGLPAGILLSAVIMSASINRAGSVFLMDK